MEIMGLLTFLRRGRNKARSRPAFKGNINKGTLELLPLRFDERSYAKVLEYTQDDEFLPIFLHNRGINLSPVREAESAESQSVENFSISSLMVEEEAGKRYNREEGDKRYKIAENIAEAINIGDKAYHYVNYLLKVKPSHELALTHLYYSTFLYVYGLSKAFELVRDYENKELKGISYVEFFLPYQISSVLNMLKNFSSQGLSIVNKALDNVQNLSSSYPIKIRDTEGKVNSIRSLLQYFRLHIHSLKEDIETYLKNIGIEDLATVHPYVIMHYIDLSELDRKVLGPFLPQDDERLTRIKGFELSTQKILEENQYFITAMLKLSNTEVKEINPDNYSKIGSAMAEFSKKLYEQMKGYPNKYAKGGINSNKDQFIRAITRWIADDLLFERDINTMDIKNKLLYYLFYLRPVSVLLKGGSNLDFALYPLFFFIREAVKDYCKFSKWRGEEIWMLTYSVFNEIVNKPVEMASGRSVASIKKYLPKGYEIEEKTLDMYGHLSDTTFLPSRDVPIKDPMLRLVADRLSEFLEMERFPHDLQKDIEDFKHGLKEYMKNVDINKLSLEELVLLADNFNIVDVPVEIPQDVENLLQMIEDAENMVGIIGKKVEEFRPKFPRFSFLFRGNKDRLVVQTLMYVYYRISYNYYTSLLNSLNEAFRNVMKSKRKVLEERLFSGNFLKELTRDFRDVVEPCSSLEEKHFPSS